jgi:hypothetical protein
MLTKSYVREFPGARPDGRGHSEFEQGSQIWRIVAELLYFPVAAIFAYVLIWSLARGEFSMFLQVLGGTP